jgi:hypothetical protein
MNMYNCVKTNVAEILFTHFNNIVFLDDRFDIYINRPTNEKDMVTDIDPTMLLYEVEKEKTEEDVAATAEIMAYNHFQICDNILSLLNYCSNYQLNLFPYVYDESFCKESFIDFLSKFSLLILDWELDDNNINLAMEIIGKYSNSKKLQYVIIYTHCPDIDKIAAIIKEYFKETDKELDIINDAKILYKKKHTFITVMEKKSISIKDAILEFSETLINKYGSLFVGFYDVVNQAQEKTGETLTDFMYPFEVLLSIQIKSDDNSDVFFNKKLTEIINSQIMAKIEVNEDIGKCIKEKTLDCAKNLKKINDQRISEITKLISFSDYKNRFKDMCDKLKDKDIWESAIIHMINNSNKFFFLNTDKENKDLGNFLKDEGISLSDKQKNDLGMLLLLLAFENIADEKSICKMIELVKLIKYSDDFDTIIESTAQNIDKSDFDTLILNKYCCGDILINKEARDKFLLCINPACDLFRPEKSGYCLKYLQGEKAEPKRLNNKLKISEHCSIIPVDEKPTIVIWNFNNERIFNLKNTDNLNELKKYTRLYKMKEDYIKQIISEYTSFYMRMGVDELFIKDRNNSIGKGFLSILK